MSGIRTLQIEPQSMDDELLDNYIELSYRDFFERRKPLPPIPKKVIRTIFLSKPPSYWKKHYYVGFVDEKMVSIGYWIESFEQTNTNRSAVYTYVEPEYRNQGIGSQFLWYILREIPDKIDTLTFNVKNEINVEPPASSSFDLKLQELGGKVAYINTTNASDVSVFDPQEVRNRANELKSKASNRGFKLVLVKDGKVRDHPDFDFEDYLQMRETIWNDMPLEDLSQEKEVFTAEESDEWYRSLQDNGFNTFTVFAIYQKTGRLAGLSEVHYNPDEPDLAFQDDTGVLERYRGYRLGMTMKYQILDLFRNEEVMQEVRWWVTGNASTNEYMLRINEQLGYETVYRQIIYEFDRNNLMDQLTGH